MEKVKVMIVIIFDDPQDYVILVIIHFNLNPTYNQSLNHHILHQ